MNRPAVECRDKSDEHDGSEDEATRPTHDVSYVPDYPARLTRSGLMRILDEAPPNIAFSAGLPSSRKLPMYAR